VLPYLGKLSRAFQADKVDFSTATSLVNVTLALVNDVQTRPDVSYQLDVEELIDRLESTAHARSVTLQEEVDKQERERGEGKGEAKGRRKPLHGNLISELARFRVRRSAQDRVEFDKNRKQYLGALRDHITRRFPSIALLEAFDRLFNPAKVPADTSAQYGAADLETV